MPTHNTPSETAANNTESDVEQANRKLKERRIREEVNQNLTSLKREIENQSLPKLDYIITEIENPNPLPSEIYNKLTETQRADYTETQRADLERLSDLATRRYPDEIINKLENRINDQLKLKSENDSMDTMFGGLLYSAYADWVEKHYGTPEKRKEIPFVRLQVLNSTLTQENFEDMKEIRNKNNLVSLELPNLYLDFITSEKLKTLLINHNSIKNITVKNGDRSAVENIESFFGIEITTLDVKGE